MNKTTNSTSTKTAQRSSACNESKMEPTNSNQDGCVIKIGIVLLPVHESENMIAEAHKRTDESMTEMMGKTPNSSQLAITERDPTMYTYTCEYVNLSKNEYSSATGCLCRTGIEILHSDERMSAFRAPYTTWVVDLIRHEKKNASSNLNAQA